MEKSIQYTITFTTTPMAWVRNIMKMEIFKKKLISGMAEHTGRKNISIRAGKLTETRNYYYGTLLSVKNEN